MGVEWGVDRSIANQGLALVRCYDEGVEKDDTQEDRQWISEIHLFVCTLTVRMHCWVPTDIWTGGRWGEGCQIEAGLWTTDMEQTFRVEAEPYQDDLNSLVFTPLGVDCRRCFCVCLFVLVCF